MSLRVDKVANEDGSDYRRARVVLRHDDVELRQEVAETLTRPRQSTNWSNAFV